MKFITELCRVGFFLTLGAKRQHTHSGTDDILAACKLSIKIKV